MELKSIEDSKKQLDYIKFIYKFDGYGDLTFPHCLCDSRKQGHVIPVFTFDSFKLKACTIKGIVEDQVIDFQYDDIVDYSIDDEELAFTFSARISNKPNKKIKLYTSFVSIEFLPYLKRLVVRLRSN